MNKEMEKFIARVDALRAAEKASKKEFNKKWAVLNKDILDFINSKNKGDK